MRRVVAILFALGVAALPAQTPPAAPVESADAALDPHLPTLFIAGDSTAARGSGATQGWGVPFAGYFDPASLNVANRARGGRSSRTFVTEGHWSALLAELKPGDIVLIQFGQNDNGGINEEPPGSTLPLRARGTIPGLGEEEQAIDNVVTKQHEIVHTYGWYLRKMIADVRAKQATPIILSLTVHDDWRHGKIERGPGHYSQWSAAIAQAARVDFVDLTRFAADRYERLGEEKVHAFFPNRPRDTTHFNAEAAELNASLVVAGLRALPDRPVDRFLSAKGREIVATK